MKNLAQANPSNLRPKLIVATTNRGKAKPSRGAKKTDAKTTQLKVVLDLGESRTTSNLPLVSATAPILQTCGTGLVASLENKILSSATPKTDNRPDKLAKSTLKEWHPEEQPRERLMKYGPQALATSELIAILLRSGTKTATAVDVARNLLLDTNGHLRELASRDWRALEKVHGIGSVKAVTLVAALELGRRRGQESDIDRPTIRTAQAAFQILGPQLADLRHEECWVLLLNTACRLIGTERLSIGGVDGTVVDVRKLMAMALRFNATSFVLAHNHPSGNLTPSTSDISLTRNLSAAGKILNISLLDHLIVAGHKFYSFSDENMLAG